MTMTSDKTIGAGAWFLLAFVAAAVARDVIYEVFVSNTVDGLSFASLVCAAVTASSFLWLVGTRQLYSLWARLKTPPVGGRVALLGPMTGLVYGVTFYLIESNRMGAGLFNLVDGGLTPILTAAIGICMWREPISWRFVLAFATYILGIAALFGGDSFHGLPLLAIAVLSPVGTAGSYGLQKWLLDDRLGGLTYGQVLFVRFLPATLTIWAYMLLDGNSLGLERLDVAIPLALGLGVPPVVLLCFALRQNSLKRFSAWFFLIPAGAYLSTLPVRPENLSLLRLFGAGLILCCIFVMEASERKSRETSLSAED